MLASKIWSMKARSLRRAARRAQKEVRYPQLQEHGGKIFTAYINEINGTPTWIIDADSLDFTLGSSISLTTESGVETAADAFVDAQKGVFGLDAKHLGEQ